MSVTHTVSELLEAAETQFEQAGLAYGHGTENAFDDACVLLRHAMGLPYDTDLTQTRWGSVVSKTAHALYSDIVQRRIAERVPSAYITGFAYVQGLKLYTDPAVIVPRSLIGEWLHLGGLQTWFDACGDQAAEPAVSSVLDLCTGSGAIALQAALLLVEQGCTHVDAVDIEPAAIALARRNVALHGLQACVHVVQGDLYAPVTGKTYDLILSNPPYVNADSMQQLPAEYRAEPALALAGGADGMDLIRRIIAGAKQHLNPNGVLVIEIGHEAEYFEAAFPHLPFIYCPVSAGDDLIVLIEAQHLP